MPSAPYLRVVYRGERIPNLYQRGERYYIRTSKDGKATWIPLKATQIQDARRERDLWFTKPATEQVVTNIRYRQHWDAVWEYQRSTNCPPSEKWSDRTAELYEGRYLTFIKPVIGEMRVSQITARDINRVMDRARGMEHMRGGEMVPYSEATLRGIWVILSRTLKYGQEVRFGPCVGASPMNGATIPSTPDGNDVFAEDILTEEEVELLCSEMTPRFKMLFQVAGGTGGRLSELCGLKWTTVNLETRTITFLHQLRLAMSKEMRARQKQGIKIEPSEWLVPLKGRPDIAHSQARTVRISPRLTELLREYREWLMSKGLYRKDGFVFPSRSHGFVGQRNVARALDAEAAKYEETIVRDLNGEVGPKPIHPHAFRHAYASRLYSTGTPLEKISVWLGHSSIDVTRKRYAKIIASLVNVEREDAWLEAAGL